MPLDNPFEPMIKNIGNYVSGTLYAQGVIPPIGIDNYDGTALASPADTHLLAAKDPVIDEIAVGMSGSLIGENTVTGAPPLQLPNSAGYPLQGLNIALSPYQEGTGDPSPDNVRPIHGTDKVTVWTGGENWSIGAQYDKSATGMSVTAQADGTAKFNNQATATFNYYWYSNSVSYSNGIWLPAGKYTYSVRLVSGTAVGGGGFGLFYWYTDDTGTRLTTQKALSFPSSKTVTFSKDVRVQPVLYFDTSAVCTDAVVAFMIERGETESDHYIPYVAPSTSSVTFGQTVYGGTYDAVTGVGALTWKKITFDGTQTPNNSSFTGTAVMIVRYGLDDVAPTGTSTDDSSTVGKCDTLKSIDRYFAGGFADWKNNADCANAYSIISSGSSIGLGFGDLSLNTVDKVNAYLMANPITVVYKLATPIPFTTDGHTIKLPKGTALTWATAEDGTVDSMEVTYVGKA